MICGKEIDGNDDIEGGMHGRRYMLYGCIEGNGVVGICVWLGIE